MEEEKERKLKPFPRKKHYRQRAHVNPLNHNYYDTTFASSPDSPDQMDWSTLYPDIPPLDDVKKMEDKNSLKKVELLDIGCGFGGLLEVLSPMFPESLILGLEIRAKVSEYVKMRIEALRSHHPEEFKNIACIRTNAMKYLPNYFNKKQLLKMFFLYPDPHFKKSKHKWRIISPILLRHYSTYLSVGGRIYLCTDVHDLFEWMVNSFDGKECQGLFRKLSDEEMSADKLYERLGTATQEGQKVGRNTGQYWRAIFEKIEDAVENTEKVEESSCDKHERETDDSSSGVEERNEEVEKAIEMEPDVKKAKVEDH